MSNKSSGYLCGLKIVIFISHKRSRVLTRYFIRLCIIVLSTCVIFLENLDDFFSMVCTDFHEVVVSTRYVPIFKYRKKILIFKGSLSFQEAQLSKTFTSNIRSLQSELTTKEPLFRVVHVDSNPWVLDQCFPSLANGLFQKVSV